MAYCVQIEWDKRSQQLVKKEFALHKEAINTYSAEDNSFDLSWHMLDQV